MKQSRVTASELLCTVVMELPAQHQISTVPLLWFNKGLLRRCSVEHHLLGNVREANSYPCQVCVVTAEEWSLSHSSLHVPSFSFFSPLLSISSSCSTAPAPGCGGAVGWFLYHRGVCTARMLQSDKGKLCFSHKQTDVRSVTEWAGSAGNEDRRS